MKRMEILQGCVNLLKVSHANVQFSGKIPLSMWRFCLNRFLQRFLGILFKCVLSKLLQQRTFEHAKERRIPDWSAWQVLLCSVWKKDFLSERSSRPEKLDRKRTFIGGSYKRLQYFLLPRTGLYVRLFFVSYPEIWWFRENQLKKRFSTTTLKVALQSLRIFENMFCSNCNFVLSLKMYFMLQKNKQK